MEREPRKRHWRAILALLGVVGLVVGVAALGGRADAAFPGANGRIVFGSQRAGEDEIWVMNADGSGKTNLTRHDGAKISDLDPSWSPDGDQIAFASDPGGDQQIWLMNADGSNPHQLTNAPPGRNRLPSWSADGEVDRVPLQQRRKRGDLSGACQRRAADEPDQRSCLRLLAGGFVARQQDRVQQ